MITSIYTCGVRLNKTDAKYTKMIMIVNAHGYLFVSRGLFVISTESEPDFDVIDKKHIGDITL